MRNEAVLQSQVRQNNLHTIKKKEGQLDWSYLAQELPTEPHYCRKDSTKN